MRAHLSVSIGRRRPAWPLSDLWLHLPLFGAVSCPSWRSLGPILIVVLVGIGLHRSEFVPVAEKNPHCVTNLLVRLSHFIRPSVRSLTVAYNRLATHLTMFLQQTSRRFTSQAPLDKPSSRTTTSKSPLLVALGPSAFETSSRSSRRSFFFIRRS